MVVLGIDPGLAIMGWGVIETGAGGAKHLQHGALLTTPRQTLPERLTALGDGMDELCRAWKPEEIVFEELFFARNVTTALLVGAARGVAIERARRFTGRLYEYTPMQVKQAITGDGKATKKQMQQMIRMLLRLEREPTPDDAADALAIALTHAYAGHSREIFQMK